MFGEGVMTMGLGYDWGPGIGEVGRIGIRAGLAWGWLGPMG